MTRAMIIARVAVGAGLVALLTAGLLVYRANGSSDPNRQGVREVGTQLEVPDTSRPALLLAPPSSAVGTADPKAARAGKRGGSSPPTASSAPVVSVTVASACVARGQAQTVTVRSQPGLQVTVNVRYADGNLGNVYGGLVFAQTVGADGSFKETWTLPDATPWGGATVYAGVASPSGPPVSGTGTATFNVAATC